MIRPFIRWAGGKQNLIEEILKHCPPDNLINRYFEPFLGAGSLFFANGFNDAFLSDVNPQLINAYQKIRSDYEKIHQFLRSYETRFLEDETFYNRLRYSYNRDREVRNHLQAARFIFLMHTNYNGMFRINLKGEYNVPIGKRVPSLPSLENLKKISEKLRGINIRTQSYSEILNNVRDGDFIYLDPPYPPLDSNNHFQQFTIDKFTTQDQKKLAEFAKELEERDCFVMISNSDVPLIRELYDDWTITQLETTRWLSCKSERKKVNELLIINY